MEEVSEADNSRAHLAAVVLAAGMGTRMRSNLPKVLHRAAGSPLISHVLDSARQAGISDIVLVVGHGRDQVSNALGDSVRYVVQEPQLGTGHALQQATSVMSPMPFRVVVLYGDVPLVTPETITSMVSHSEQVAIVVLTAVVPDPTGYGRIVRDDAGRVLAIVEEADTSGTQRGIREINSGLYCFDGDWLLANLGSIQKSPKGEYYLTDLVAMAVGQGREVRGVLAADAAEVEGVNNRSQLAEADRVLRSRYCERLMASGVTIVDPANTYIGKDVVAGRDTVIQPGTHLRGRTVIGEGCEIGPNTIIEDSSIGDECNIVSSVVEQSRVADRVSIGPFSHLRPGAVIEAGAKLGNYAEVKNSTLGRGVQMHHFSYVGDAEVGAETNVGAGTITCNYDGRTRKKYRTKIGKRVFLGSDTLLRAPVELGDDAQTGAGSVVTRDVPPGKLAVGVPARIREIRGRPEPEKAKTDDGGGNELGS